MPYSLIHRERIALALGVLRGISTLDRDFAAGPTRHIARGSWNSARQSSANSLLGPLGRDCDCAVRVVDFGTLLAGAGVVFHIHTGSRVLRTDNRFEGLQDPHRELLLQIA